MIQTKAHQGNDDNDGKPVQRDEDFMQPLKINLLVLCKFIYTTHYWCHVWSLIKVKLGGFKVLVIYLLGYLSKKKSYISLRIKKVSNLGFYLIS